MTGVIITNNTRALKQYISIVLGIVGRDRSSLAEFDLIKLPETVEFSGAMVVGLTVGVSIKRSDEARLLVGLW